MRNFVFLGPTIFDHLSGEGVWVIRFGLEFLDNYEKLSTYLSPKPTLTLISHLGWNVGLRRLGGHCIGTCITFESAETNVPFGSLEMITSPHLNCFIVILAITIIIILIIIIIININSNINVINNVNINININNNNSL